MDASAIARLETQEEGGPPIADGTAELASRFSSKTHLAAMDGVRGLAILAVLVYHGVVWTTVGKGTVLTTLNIVPRALWTERTLFFALSGFLDYRDPPPIPHR